MLLDFFILSMSLSFFFMSNERMEKFSYWFFCIIKRWNFYNNFFSHLQNSLTFLLLLGKTQQRMQQYRLSCESCCQLTIHNALSMYRQYVFIRCSLMIKFKLKKKSIEIFHMKQDEGMIRGQNISQLRTINLASEIES